LIYILLGLLVLSVTFNHFYLNFGQSLLKLWSNYRLQRSSLA